MARGPSAKSQTEIGRKVRGTSRWAPTDGRATKCYRWEWSNADLLRRRETLSRDVAKGMARLMCKVVLKRIAERHGRDVASLEMYRAEFVARFTREDARYCHAGENGAYFAKWGWSPGVIAHEVAHWADTVEMRVLNQRGERTAHGPHWLGWFVFLLIDVAKVDETALRASLATAKLRFAMP